MTRRTSIIETLLGLMSQPFHGNDDRLDPTFQMYRAQFRDNSATHDLLDQPARDDFLLIKSMSRALQAASPQWGATWRELRRPKGGELTNATD